MNHLTQGFASRDGRVFKSHSWELHEGGYRRLALLVGGGARPVDQEPRLIGFLLERGFRIAALDLAYGAPVGPGYARPDLRAFREALSSFAASNESPDLPLYVIAESFSAGALLPVAEVLPTAAAWALVAPVVEFPPPGAPRPCFLAPSVTLKVGPEELCGDPELRGAMAGEALSFSFRMRDLRLADAELGATMAAAFACPVAAFSGESDPFLGEAGRVRLQRFGAKVYGYPRVRHDPGRDRYADNFYADLGSFLDEVEASARE